MSPNYSDPRLDIIEVSKVRRKKRVQINFALVQLDIFFVKVVVENKALKIKEWKWFDDKVIPVKNKCSIRKHRA
jgi:hypothetical protein